MVKDKISNLINGLKNASTSRKATLVFEYSNLSKAILDLLQKENFIEAVVVKEKDAKKDLKITLKYVDGKPAINGTKRISKFSKRIYKGVKSIPTVKNGYGIAVITTPNGIVSGKMAREQKVGGEVLFEIW